MLQRRRTIQQQLRSSSLFMLIPLVHSSNRGLLNSRLTALAYNIGNNALTYTYLVELYPFAERARGIAIEQFFGRGAGFFSTYLNPIALKAITWKYLAVYCGWIAIEVLFVYFFYPETHGRTLEELAFCK